MHRLITDDSNNAKRPQNPRTNANIFEILTFSWMLKLFRKGRKIDLEENDLYTILNDHKSSSLGNELEKKWRLELVTANTKNRNPSLLRTLLQMYGARYMFYGCMFCIDEIILKMSQPMCIAGLLSYFNPDGSNKMNIKYAYIYASGLVLSMLCSIVLYHTTQLEVVHCGMKLRIACCSTIFRKALRLSHSALGSTTVGQVINLISNDVNRFDIALTFLHYLWIGPLQTMIVTYFVWQEIGVSSLLGVATMLFFIPLQAWLGKKMSQFRLKTACMADERVRLMNEIISGIQVIKMYTWEKPFSNIIEYARKKEVQQLRGISYIRTTLSSFSVIQTRFQLFISILSYVLLGNYISIRKVFVITSLYNLLLPTMTIFFSRGLGQIAELLITIKRIQHFLLHDEKDGQIPNCLRFDKEVNDDITELIKYNGSIQKEEAEWTNDFGIVISNATAKWTNNQTVNTLENINLTVRSNRLVAIIGPVGAGKSSLIQAILRELPLSKGSISVHGVVSYASQEPWLFAGSIQQNILFDSPMDTERYKQVINVCALKSDIKQFPYGDKTFVGERGVTLSGGQRARINLARAVYKQADIYLLDDPLSAVDTRIGKHLFEKCIQGYLKEKTCILVTHQLQYLTNVDKMVLMDNANILGVSSYQELKASGFDFAKLIGSSEDVTTVSDIDDINKHSKNVNTPITISPRASNESIYSYVGDTKFNGVLAEPKEVIELHSYGNVKKSDYISYFYAGGSTFKIYFCLFLCIITQVMITGGDYWICFWVNQEEYVFRNEYLVSADNDSTITHNSIDTLMTSSNYREIYVIVYSVLIVSMLVTILTRSMMFVSVFMCASKNLHNWMFNAIIRATMYFFNTNSSGRIFNRFSKDIGVIDDILPLVILECMQILACFIGIIFIVGLVNIYFMIPTFIMAIAFYRFRVYFLPTSRGVKRLELVARSPVFAHMNASMQGLTIIRAFEAEQILSKEFDKYQDLHSSAWYLFISSNEAFGYWLDIICLFYISIVIFTLLFIKQNIYGGDVGLVITQTIGLTGMVQWGVRQSAVLENQMTSVERILEYTRSPQEAALKSPSNKPLPEGWPKFGKIVFQNVNLRYSPDAPYILKDLSIIIQPKEKVGIVGRTGAGKSSIVGALFRLANNEGKIIIDDVEIHDIGLHDLRSKMSIIPQEPVLFSGTMRMNLDPFDEYADHVLWNALDEVELKGVIEILPGGLNSKVSENGLNFSVGQRQLICLARAIVRHNKILILDEATANIDRQTDTLIQNTIRNKFKMCTVLTIAHRLNTIMDSDKILVMDGGKIVEFDHPYNLLKNNKDGFLYKMVQQTGQASADFLHDVAAQAFKTMQMNKESPNEFISSNNLDGVSDKTL